MTGNQVKGKSFRGALRYNLEKVENKVAEVLDLSFVNISEKTIMKEVQMIRMLKPNLQKYFYHTSINFPPNEELSNEKMKQIGLDYLEGNGFQQHQYIMFRHHDADHPHLHIIVNRIGYDGKVVSDSNDFARSEKVLRALEKKYKLTQVISSHKAKERAITKNELEMMKRTNLPSSKMAVQVILNKILQNDKKPTTAEFIAQLEEKDVKLLFNQATTGYVSGISYCYNGIIIKGAKLGSNYKWPSIKNNINYEQERDRTEIYGANLRSVSVKANLSADHDPHQGSRGFAQQDSAKQQPPVQQYQNAGTISSNISKQSRQHIQRVRQSEQPNRIHKDQVYEKPKSISLASLLDSHRCGNNLQHDHESDMVVNELKRGNRKRKKRKRLRY